MFQSDSSLATYTRFLKNYRTIDPFASSIVCLQAPGFETWAAKRHSPEVQKWGDLALEIQLCFECY